MFKKGILETFKNNEDMFEFINKKKYVYMGLFIINGKLEVAHENYKERNLRRMTRLKSSRIMDADNYDSDKHIASKVNMKKPLDRNLFSLRQVDHFNTKFDTENKIRNNVLENGNALEIYVDYLDSIRILSDHLTVFILEYNTQNNSDNNHLQIGNTNNNAFNKINRKKYM